MKSTPKAKQNILTRQMPKTGQTISFAANDDGMIEAGWWKGRLNANNRTRFIIKTIGGDDIVLDRATGLMWARDGSAAGCNNGNLITWANALLYATGLVFASFEDWRVPNIAELFSILNYESTPPMIYTSFTNTLADRYWSSTSQRGTGIGAWNVSFSTGLVISVGKTTEYYLRCVRKGL